MKTEKNGDFWDFGAVTIITQQLRHAQHQQQKH